MTQRFQAGDVVRTRGVNPEGHTRLPGYLCGRRGTIEAVHGLVALADESARGARLGGPTKEALYTVVFDGTEVWRQSSTERLSVAADLWDSYLEPAGGP
jgi:hypothetical protein